MYIWPDIDIMQCDCYFLENHVYLVHLYYMHSGALLLVKIVHIIYCSLVGSVCLI